MKNDHNNEKDRRSTLRPSFSGGLVAMSNHHPTQRGTATISMTPTKSRRTPRRNSIAAIDTRLVPLTSSTASYHLEAPDRSYNDLEEITKLTKQKMYRRNSMTKVERRYSGPSSGIWMDYGKESLLIDSNDNLQTLKERFQQSRSSVLSGSSHNIGVASGWISQRSSVIGSVVGAGCGTTATGGGDDEDYSMEMTMGSPGGLESSEMCVSVPMSLVQKTTKRQRKYDLKRQNLIESLVNFSCHTPSAVLEDLIVKELKLWKEGNDRRQQRHQHLNRQQNAEQSRPVSEDSERQFEDDMEDESTVGFDHEEGSLSSLSSDGRNRTNHQAHLDRERRGSVDMSVAGSIDPLEQQLLTSQVQYSLPGCVERDSALLFVDISGFTKLSTMLDVESLR